MSSINKTVVTGMGVVSALGLNVEDTWKNLLSGMSGVKNVSLFDAKDSDTKIAAEVDSEFIKYSETIISRRDRKQMTRATKMGVVAAKEAIKNSGINLENYDKTRIVVIMGVIGTYTQIERNLTNYSYVVRSMPNAPSAWISLYYGIEGPNFNVSTACASSGYAISLGHQMIKYGLADIAIVGGTDSSIDAEYFYGFNQIMAMSSRNDSPETASRPFTLSRDGFVMGEGSGVLVLESEKIAKERNAHIICELAGYALTSEATDITAPKENGVGMAKTMSRALEDAGVGCDEIDYINAHGTGTYLNDKYETMAIKKCFGERAKEIGISSSKSMIGHTLGASGAIEAIITASSVYNNILTPTINYFDPDPELDLDYIPNQAREKEVRAAISNSFGFGGHNATLVFKKYK